MIFAILDKGGFMSLKNEIQEKIEESKADLDLAQEIFGGVFISQDENSTETIFEVFCEDGEFAFTVCLELSEMKAGTTPQEVYEMIKDCLEEENIDVFDSFEEWESALEEVYG